MATKIRNYDFVRSHEAFPETQESSIRIYEDKMQIGKYGNVSNYEMFKIFDLISLFQISI